MDNKILIQKKEVNPKVSVIIPAFNCAVAIPYTIESLLKQDYENLEILVVDGDSKDRTIEIIKSYRSPLIQIFSNSRARCYEMINKGINEATGQYVTTLFPGDVYISPFTLSWMMEEAEKADDPDLIYCGTLRRGSKEALKMLYYPFDLNLLKSGRQPTCLSACFFKAELFIRMGKFNYQYQWRGDYEFFCRLAKEESLKVFSIKRYLVDHEVKSISRRIMVGNLRETASTIYRLFGIRTFLRWLCQPKGGEHG